MNLRIVSYDSRSPYLRAAVRIYVDVWGYDYRDSVNFFARYSQFEGFVGQVALLGDRPVGMAFGVASQLAQWWHEKVAERIGDDHPALQNAWLLTELAVLAPYRGRSIGAHLHDSIIRAQTRPNLLLSTQVDNVAARRFYERRGWKLVHPGFAFQAGHTEYLIMSRTLEVPEDC